MSNIKMLKTIIYVNSINNLVSIMEKQCPWQSRDWMFCCYTSMPRKISSSQ